MAEPKTLLQLSGANLKPATVNAATLVLIDFQNEYRAGPVSLGRADPAIANAAHLLALARQAGSPIVHVAHAGRAGGLFDRAAQRGQIVTELAPQPGEVVIEKPLPNAFAGTNLADVLAKIGRKELIVGGFMTHMCVSSTARAALDAGYRVTIDANSCATRDLPDGRGGVVHASTLHEVSLVALSDRFAVIARDHSELG
jgi:nicotinamidase-related amidase